MQPASRAVACFALIAALMAAAPGCVRHAALPLAADQVRSEPPPGTVEVDFVSGEPFRVWDVYADGREICTTPCLRTFPAGQSFLLESTNGEAVFVSDLGAEANQARRAIVLGEGRQRGKYVNGIVFTTLGGMGIVTAITFTAVGCSDVQRRPGTCSAGLITGAASIPVTAFALWLLLDSLPRAHVLPVWTTKPEGNAQTPTSVTLTPNGIAGTF